MRSALIPESRFGRYFFYALGEIALVVIGILIALQVNTWNESRKAGIKERMLLSEMMKNLESNVRKLENMLEGYKRDNFSSAVIISALENKIEYNDTLDVHFAQALNQSSEGPLLSFVSYESLKSSGFDIIRNDQLRNEIISLFELTYGNLQNKNDRVGQIYPLISKFKHEHLMRKPGFKFAPYDFKSLAEDKIFLSWLYSIKDNRSWIAQNIEISLQHTQRVLQLVKYELNEN